MHAPFEEKIYGMHANLNEMDKLTNGMKPTETRKNDLTN